MSIAQRFCKEVLTWKSLRHQNILPLLGVAASNNQFAMVSEWMTNGNISEFVRSHREANRFKLVGPLFLPYIVPVIDGIIFDSSETSLEG